MKDRSNRENAEMFDQIAVSYDFLNHLLSLNIDKGWRRKAIRSLAGEGTRRILDVATGTGDMAIGALALGEVEVVGVDASKGMLDVGRKKLKDKGLDGRISMVEGSCENLPFGNAEFDAAMVAFGVRNFTDPALGLSEISRVLRPGGKFAVLEFTLPHNRLILGFYRFYFHRIVPLLGRLFSKDLSAYRYLPDSVEAFPKGKAFIEMMGTAGFTGVRYEPLTFGICGLYTGRKGPAE